MRDLVLDRNAVISACGRYRYSLSRLWDHHRPVATFIMLNPSTADAVGDDATIRKCMGFAHRWGMGGVLVGNLFAVRATDPRDLLKADDPVGPDNELHLERICREAGATGNGGIVVCAWGASGGYMGQDQTFLGWCDGRWSLQSHALGFTSQSQPRHPLYVPYDAELVPLL